MERSEGKDKWEGGKKKEGTDGSGSFSGMFLFLSLSLVDSIPVERTCVFLLSSFLSSSSYLVMMTASFPRSGFPYPGSLSWIYLSSLSPLKKMMTDRSTTDPSNVKSTRTPPPPSRLEKSCLFVQPKHIVSMRLVVHPFPPHISPPRNGRVRAEVVAT